MEKSSTRRHERSWVPWSRYQLQCRMSWVSCLVLQSHRINGMGCVSVGCPKGAVFWGGSDQILSTSPFCPKQNHMVIPEVTRTEGAPWIFDVPLLFNFQIAWWVFNCTFLFEKHGDRKVRGKVFLTSVWYRIKMVLEIWIKIPLGCESPPLKKPHVLQQ